MERKEASLKQGEQLSACMCITKREILSGSHEDLFTPSNMDYCSDRVNVCTCSLVKKEVEDELTPAITSNKLESCEILVETGLSRDLGEMAAAPILTSSPSLKCDAAVSSGEMAAAPVSTSSQSLQCDTAVSRSRGSAYATEHNNCMTIWQDAPVCDQTCAALDVQAYVSSTVSDDLRLSTTNEFSIQSSSSPCRLEDQYSAPEGEAVTDEVILSNLSTEQELRDSDPLHFDLTGILRKSVATLKKATGLDRTVSLVNGYVSSSFLQKEVGIAACDLMDFVKTPLTCEVCNKSFTRKWHFKSHLLIHNNIRKFVCEICNRAFIQKGNLNAHMLIHQNIRLFKCEICAKPFTYKQHLKKHMLMHSNIKPFECGICGKSFGYKSNLNKHMVVHSNDRAFKCDVCSKFFTQKVHLKTHMSVHNNVRPFVCQVCNRSFTQRGNLKKHMLVHGSCSFFECEICSRPFTRKDNLNTHMLLHRNIRGYQCEICHKSFVHKASLMYHLQSQIHS